MTASSASPSSFGEPAPQHLHTLSPPGMKNPLEMEKEIFSPVTGASRHGQLLLLALSIFTTSGMRFMFGPVQEAVRASLRLTDHQIALLQGSAMAIPLALGSVPMGVLIARYPRSYLLVFALTLALAGHFLTAFGVGFAAMFVARFMVGLSMAMVFVAAYSMVGDLYEPGQRGRATMMITIGEVGGGPAAFALGAALLAATSAPLFNLEGWRAALLEMSVPVIVIIPLMLLLREPPKHVVGGKAAVSESWRDFWSYRGIIIPLLLSRIMVWIADTAVMVWGISIFSRRFSMSLAQTSAMMASTLLVSGILGPVLGGPLADWCQRTGGPRRTVTTMALLTALSVPAALFGVAPTAFWAGIGATALLMMGFMVGVMAMAVTNIAVPSEQRGRFVGVQFTSAAIAGLGLTPLIVSSLSSWLGGEARLGTAVAIVGVAGSVLGAVCFAVASFYFSGATMSAPRERAASVTTHP